MSCNGCRILRKGCNDNCILRQSLQGIETSQAQSNATVFVAKFFGRAGLISFLSSVPESQRPALFQSLLFEACGRTVNPVTGAVGLLGTGNWHVCQSAVETVLNGGVLRALAAFDEDNVNSDLYGSRDLEMRVVKSELGFGVVDEESDLDLGLTANGRRGEKRRSDSPSDESETTTFESGFICQQDLQLNQCGGETKLLRLFF